MIISEVRSPTWDVKLEEEEEKGIDGVGRFPFSSNFFYYFDFISNCLFGKQNNKFFSLLEHEEPLWLVRNFFPFYNTSHTNHQHSTLSPSRHSTQRRQWSSFFSSLSFSRWIVEKDLCLWNLLSRLWRADAVWLVELASGAVQETKWQGVGLITKRVVREVWIFTGIERPSPSFHHFLPWLPSFAESAWTPLVPPL